MKITEKCLIDLHLHLDGSISPASARRLAEMQQISIPESDEELLSMLRAPESCGCLGDYLTAFDFPLTLLQTAQAIRESIRTLLFELDSLGVIYAEIRFAPQLHTRMGLTQEQVVSAAVEALSDSPIPAGLILCCMRSDDNYTENEETCIIAEKFYGKGVVALDIAGAESPYPNELFPYIFAFAAENEIPMTVHSGEAAGAENVEQALDFGVKRIGHGVRAYEDEAVMKKLADSGVYLELCPKSNLDTNVFDSIDRFPLRTFLTHGIKCTINSDDMSVSDTDVRRDMQRVADTFSLTRDEVKILLLNSAEAAFCDEKIKVRLREAIGAEFI